MSSNPFPNLTSNNWIRTSPATPIYNCIAYAAGEQDRWWWPDTENTNYWPSSVPREETLEAFIASYGTLDYVVCADGSLETGFEKIVIYSNNDVPTHASRQIPTGMWVSKLGNNIDIQHETPQDLEGPCYGCATVYMKRKL